MDRAGAAKVDVAKVVGAGGAVVVLDDVAGAVVFAGVVDVVGRNCHKCRVCSDVCGVVFDAVRDGCADGR